MSSEEKMDPVWLLIILVIFGGILLMLMWWPWGGHMSGMMGFGWGFMFLIPLLFLALIAVGAYYLLTEFARSSGPSSGGGKRALEILKERYARGEITREQFLKMKEGLEL